MGSGWGRFRVDCTSRLAIDCGVVGEETGGKVQRGCALVFDVDEEERRVVVKAGLGDDVVAIFLTLGLVDVELLGEELERGGIDVAGERGEKDQGSRQRSG